MSGRSHRRRIPVPGRKARSQHHSSVSPHRKNSPASHHRSNQSKHGKVLHRCPSEPVIWNFDFVAGDNRRNLQSDMLLLRPKTCTDMFLSSPELPFPASQSQEVGSIFTFNVTSDLQTRLLFLIVDWLFIAFDWFSGVWFFAVCQMFIRNFPWSIVFHSALRKLKKDPWKF